MSESMPLLTIHPDDTALGALDTALGALGDTALGEAPLAIHPALKDTPAPLTRQQVRGEQRRLQDALGPLVELSVSRDGQTNYLGARVRRQYLQAVFTHAAGGLLFVFVPSEKLEPALVVVAVAGGGRVAALDARGVHGLRAALAAFERRFAARLGLFLYNPRAVRVAAPGTHSAHFHCKAVLSWELYVRLFPIAAPVLGRVLAADPEYLRHFFARERLAWPALAAALLGEAARAPSPRAPSPRATSPRATSPRALLSRRTPGRPDRCHGTRRPRGP